MTAKGEHPIKKFIMLWLWRLQQISQPVNTAMLALTLTLTVAAFIHWRFENPYIGIMLTFLAIVCAIALVGWSWDRVRMWHEQSVVSVERNPFFMHKMNPKEVAIYKFLWLPLLRELGKPELADAWEEWVDGQVAADPILEQRVRELRMRYFTNGGVT